MQNIGNDNIKHIQDQTKLFIFGKTADLPLYKFMSYICAVSFKTYTSILILFLINLYQNDAHKIVIMKLYS